MRDWPHHICAEVQTPLPPPPLLPLQHVTIYFRLRHIAQHTEKHTHTIIILTVIQLCKHTQTHMLIQRQSLTRKCAHTKDTPKEQQIHSRATKVLLIQHSTPSVVGDGDESQCVSTGTRVTFSHGGCLEAQMCAGVISADSRGECGGKPSLFMRLNESRCNFILWRRSPHVPPGRQRVHHV